MVAIRGTRRDCQGRARREGPVALTQKHSQRVGKKVAAA